MYTCIHYKDSEIKCRNEVTVPWAGLENFIRGAMFVAEGRAWGAQLKLVSGQKCSDAFCLGQLGAKQGYGGSCPLLPC